MPQHVFTRQALYDLVWAEPIRTVAQRYGVSDVGLAKACRRAAIPTPPRGYWVKRQHGKPLPKRPALPKREDLNDRVMVAPDPPKRAPKPEIQAVLDRAADGAQIAVPATLRNPHPVVAAWLDEAEKRRRNARRHGWSTPRDDETNPIRHRQLRIYSALFKALDRQGFSIRREGFPDAGVTASKAGEEVRFNLYPRSKVVMRPATADEQRWQPDRKTVRMLEPAGDLILKIQIYLSIPAEFKELKRPLDAQLVAVVASLEAAVLAKAEQRRESALAAERWREEEALRRHQLAHREAQAQQTERLFQQAAAFERAASVRALVAAADATDAVEAPGYAVWRAWALGQADQADPLATKAAPFELVPSFEDWMGAARRP